MLIRDRHFIESAGSSGLYYVMVVRIGSNSAVKYSSCAYDYNAAVGLVAKLNG